MTPPSAVVESNADGAGPAHPVRSLVKAAVEPGATPSSVLRNAAAHGVAPGSMGVLLSARPLRREHRNAASFNQVCAKRGDNGGDIRRDIAKVSSRHLRLVSLRESGRVLFVVTESEFVHSENTGRGIWRVRIGA